MISVLVVMTWFGGYVSGPAVTMTEFASNERCEAAVRKLYAEATAWSIYDNKIRAFCVLK